GRPLERHRPADQRRLPRPVDRLRPGMEITKTGERYASGGPAKDLAGRNLIEAFEATVARLPQEVAIRMPGDPEYSIAWSALRDRVRAIAGGLAGLGVGRGDTVALLLNNRPEFIPCDLATVAIGGVPFSIYQTAAPEQIAYQIPDSGARVAGVETTFP